MHALGAWCMRASGGQCPALRARPFRHRPLSDSSGAGRPLTSELELVLRLEAQDLLHLRHGPPRRGRRREWGGGAAAWVAGLRGGGRGRGAGRAHGTHDVRTHAPTHTRTHVRSSCRAPAMARGSSGKRETAHAYGFLGHCAGTDWAAEGGASATRGVVSRGLGGGAISSETVQ